MLADLVRDRRVAVCIGGGGVGKTTTAAALGLAAAREGRRVVVVTIDPARRLADALGLDALGDEPRRVGGPALRGELWAMMLEQKRAWDRLVARHAPSDAARARIVANPIYRHLSESFAGSYELMAIEQLCALVEGSGFDLVVLDTPPARHALDFFEAPARVLAFLDRRVVRWLLVPYAAEGRAVASAVGRTGGRLLALLEEATGAEVLGHASELFVALSGLFDAFAGRAAATDAILRGPDTAFILVAGPDERSVAEAERFAADVRALGLRLSALVVNRVHPQDAALPALDAASLAAAGVTGARAAWMAENLAAHRTLANGQAARIAELARRCGRDVTVAVVPEVDDDLHDLGGIARLCTIDPRTSLNPLG